MLLGKLIPAGTGLKKYRNLHLDMARDEREEIVTEGSDSLDYEDYRAMEDEYADSQEEGQALILEEEPAPVE